MMKNTLKCVGCFALVLLTVSATTAADTVSYRFERMWPTLRQAWYFNSPYGVAVDARGTVYVADGFYHQIQKFSAHGRFITKWGTEGTGPGQFGVPADVAVDNNGNVIVVDSVNQRVLLFTSAGVFVREWGQGILMHPQGVSIDSFSNVYVADTDNHRIQVFDMEGTPLRFWGTRGPGNGQLDTPAGVAVDLTGRVWVADAGNHRIQVFSSGGDFLAAWGTEGDGPGQFRSPVGVAVDAQGCVYVADATQCRVQRFDATGALVGSWGRTGDGRGEFARPDGIAVAPGGHVFVTDRNAHDFVHVFTPDGVNVASWGSQQSGSNEYNNPTALAKDAEGRIYVCDFGNSRIQRLTGEGRFDSFWGPLRGDPGACARPYDMAIAQDYVYVSDLADQRIRRYSLGGIFQLEWGGPGMGNGEFMYYVSLCVDDLGNVYASDTLGQRIQKFTPDGVFVASFGDEGAGPGQFEYPTGLAYAPGAVVGSGNLYVADSQNNRVQKLTTDGVFAIKWGTEGTGAGQFSNPSSVEVGLNGEVFVADSDNHRIQRFTSDGVFVTMWGDYGHNPGQMQDPTDVLALPNDRVLVADYLNNRLQRFSAITQAENVKAIIVAGGGPFPGNQLWDTTELCANFAYRALTYQGYDKSMIYYLSSDIALDLDSNGKADDVNAIVTKANLQIALTQWAAGADSVVVYLIDHGGVGTFRLSEAETLDATDFAAMLSDAQHVVTGRVVVVVDACHSGSLIEALAKTSDANRVVVASTPSDQPAYFLGLGSVSFSSFFWSEIFNGESIGSAFSVAKDSLHLTVPRQVPMLDADGDGQANGSGDVTVAESMFLGGANLASTKPVIGDIATEVINGTSTATLTATLVTPSDDIETVWAVIRAPGDTGAQTSGQPVMDMPSAVLWPTDAPNTYEGRYQGFTTPGAYQVAVYAQDRSLNVSVPKVISVSVDSPLRRRAVIVAGLETSDATAELIDQNMNLVYETLRFQGYTDDDIQYLSPRSVSAGWDAPPTTTGLRDVLTVWAAENTQDLVLYMIGAGGAGHFDMGGREILFAGVLKVWLDGLQATLPGPVTVVYDACASGSFLPLIVPEEGRKRIVISSTQADASATFSIQGGLSFSQFFWRQVLNGANVRSAFQYAANAIRFGKNARKPQLDDNGDGVYDTRSDGALAMSYTIGVGVLLAGDEPIIGTICDAQELNGGDKTSKDPTAPHRVVKDGPQTSASIWVSDVTSTGALQSVWAVITPPGYDSHQCGASSAQENILSLQPSGGNRYEGAYNGFTERGIYQILAYAMDTEGNVSLPMESVVRQEDAYVTPDAYEPDDTFDQASWIGYGGANQEHNFSKSGDVDWARFYVEAGNTMVVRTLQLGAEADTYIRLYRSDGTTLLEEDDNGGGDASSYLTWDVDITGFYLVRVNNMPDTTFGADASYQLRVGDLTGDLLSGAIACTVADADTALPVQGATLRLNFGGLSLRTATNGTAVFPALPAKTYTLTTEATGYISRSQNVTVVAADVKAVSISLTPEGEGEGEGEGEQVGSLAVMIEPKSARDDGAQWRVDGNTWQNSGVTLSGLTVGQHLVEFNDIPPEESSGCFGPQEKPWTTPASQTINVTAGRLTTITGTYVLSQKALAASVPGSSSRGDVLLIASVGSVLLASRKRRRKIPVGS